LRTLSVYHIDSFLGSTPIAHYIECAANLLFTLCYTVAMLARTLLSAVALLVTLAGCASTQEAENKQALTFLQVKAAPDSFKGQTAVFGGKVLTARRQKDGTKIEILQLPLDQSTRPGYDLTQSQGRFIAIYREFLDPATVPHGTRITVTGEVSGSITLPLDETDYTYPVIDIKRVQVWAGWEDVAPRISPYYMGPGPYWGPYWSPYWRPWPYW
jgi:outer membrane lipoprotein